MFLEGNRLFFGPENSSVREINGDVVILFKKKRTRDIARNPVMHGILISTSLGRKAPGCVREGTYT